MVEFINLTEKHLTNGIEIKHERTTLHINNKRNSNEIKAFDSHYTLCVSKSFAHLNSLIVLYQPLEVSKKDAIETMKK